MRRTYKPLFWRATRPVNSTDGMIEGRYCLKRIIIDIFILYFTKYLHSFIQSAMFTGRVARQNNGLYVLSMIVKLAYYKSSYSFCLCFSSVFWLATSLFSLFSLVPLIAASWRSSLSSRLTAVIPIIFESRHSKRTADRSIDWTVHECEDQNLPPHTYVQSKQISNFLIRVRPRGAHLIYVAARSARSSNVNFSIVSPFSG